MKYRLMAAVAVMIGSYGAGQAARAASEPSVHLSASATCEGVVSGTITYDGGTEAGSTAFVRYFWNGNMVDLDVAASQPGSSNFTVPTTFAVGATVQLQAAVTFDFGGEGQEFLDPPSGSTFNLSIPNCPIPDGGTEPWGGTGSKNLPCADGAHWVLSPANNVTAASVTVDGVTYPMTQSGNGSWSADSAGPVTDESDVSWSWEGAGDEMNHLQLSHCLGDSTTTSTTSTTTTTVPSSSSTTSTTQPDGSTTSTTTTTTTTVPSSSSSTSTPVVKESSTTSSTVTEVVGNTDGDDKSGIMLPVVLVVVCLIGASAIVVARRRTNL